MPLSPGARSLARGTAELEIRSGQSHGRSRMGIPDSDRMKNGTRSSDWKAMSSLGTDDAVEDPFPTRRCLDTSEERHRYCIESIQVFPDAWFSG
jgi:hypothetical protein